MERKKLIAELLTLLERKELCLLEWGFLDGSFSSEEIVAIFRGADEQLVAKLNEYLSTTSADLFIDNLAEANILVRVGDRYRSRFAESLRLMGRLRQRFGSDDWRSAPQLVSGWKVHLSARSYPKRNIPVSVAFESLKEVCWSQGLQEQVFHALLKSGNDPIDLAGFQVRATKRILSRYRTGASATGTVVSAGTGSGKTKAFYLPAFMGMAADIAQDRRHYLKVLAIYPRNVLLADQFSEAVSEAIRLLTVNVSIPRAITFGAFLGDTPYTTKLAPGQRALKNWRRTQSGWIPPFVRHPANGSDLIWLDSDREAGRSTLCSIEQPNVVVVPDGMIRLTREQIRSHPPDVLMMSVEMLNKEMSSPVSASMLGFNKALPPPRLVLLDEVHTYEGTSGAQVPWILRRWSYWMRRGRNNATNPHFVGLSATLKEAELHLAALTGTSEGAIAEIRPEHADDELESEGIEYNVALRSHAGSGATVLATSIQTVMLGARLLTPAISGRIGTDNDNLSSTSYFGKKVFGFTDNLDGLNRWMYAYTDADWNRKLARHRAPSPGVDYAARLAEGQIWTLPVSLGHDLAQGLRPSRCSSQDPGIDAGATVVLATSSLEVGYDDPEVGMVVHHKAPRSAASFLQRKGRAGRKRGVRPWTVVVLSDFGRDRWAFRDSERIFQPELEPLKIPALNPYVMRIQATQFLIDWVGQRVGRGDPYRYLANRDKTGQDTAKALLNSLVSNPSSREEFIRDMTFWMRGGATGLRLGDVEPLVNSILWEPPRAVLRHAVPELAKSLAGEFLPLGASRPLEFKRPLPRFIPAATFGVLDTQEVAIQIGDHAEAESVDVALALREATPCRASRRYAVSVRKNALWHSASDSIAAAARESVSVADVFSQSISIGSISGVEIFQPLALRLVEVPDDVKDSSAASWRWQFHALYVGKEERLGLADGPVLSRVFVSSTGHFHRRYAQAQITRYSCGFRYEVLRAKGVKQRGYVRLCDSDATDAPRAVGYRRSVDAIKFVIGSNHLNNRPPLDDGDMRRLRPHFFRYKLNESPILNSVTSAFGITALWNSSIAMLAATALVRGTTLRAASALIPDRSAAATKVFSTMMLGEVVGDDLDEQQEGRSRSNRRIQEIQELWRNSEVNDEMRRLETTLWDEHLDGFDEWLTKIYLETLASALQQAIWTIMPEIAEEDIAIDVNVCPDEYSLVLSETAAGGVGHLQRLVTEVGNNPERLDMAFEAAIRSCENDRMTGVVLGATNDAKDRFGELSSVFAEVRSAISFDDLQQAKDNLVTNLERHNLDSDRPSVSALASKVLRPGSSRKTDAWIRVLNSRRSNMSRKIGMSIDSRVFAYWCLHATSLNKRMTDHLHEIGRSAPTPDQLYSAFVQLTFDGCADSCPECLGLGKEMEGIVPSRKVATSWIGLDSIDYHIDTDAREDWRQLLESGLREAHRIRLTFDDDKRNDVALELSRLLAQDHDRGYIFSPFTTEGASRHGKSWSLTLHPATSPNL